MAAIVPVYSFASPRQQLWPFPPDVIKFMINNLTSPKGLGKLYQTCKYFYGKQPLLIAKSVNIEYRGENTVVKIKEGCREHDVTRLQAFVWATGYLWISGRNETHIKELPKLFRYSMKHVTLMACSLQYKEFLYMATEKSIRNLLIPSQFFYEDMSRVPIECVIPLMPHAVSIFYCIDENCTAETLKALVEDVTIDFPILDMLSLDIIKLSPAFDINMFCELVAKITDASSTIVVHVLNEDEVSFSNLMKELDMKWRALKFRNLIRALNDVFTDRNI